MRDPRTRATHRVVANSFILHPSSSRTPVTMRSYSHSLDGLERPLPPENEYMYRTKPLPLLPKEGHRSRSRSTQSLTSAPRQLHGRRSVDHLHQRPLHVVVPTSPQHGERMSLPSPSITTRRFSKVHQLTGYDVASVDYLPLRRIISEAVAASPTDTSSNYSRSLDGPIFEEDAMSDAMPRFSESSGPPPLEPDCDGTSSKRSSGAPRSPQPGQFGAPGYRKSSLSRYNSVPNDLNHLPDLLTPFPEDIPWRASKSYHYFSDAETADEYHRIASDLATLPTRQSTCSPASTHSSFSNRLSLTAKALFSRRREPPASLHPRSTSFGSEDSSQKTAYPPIVAVVSDSEASPPRSVFETDDDEEEGDHHMREAIKDFFVRRSEERASTDAILQRPPPPPPPRPVRPEPTGILSKTGDHVKELFVNGAKRVHTSKAEKRRNELRSRIRVIPEGIVADNVF